VKPIPAYDRSALKELLYQIAVALVGRARICSLSLFLQSFFLRFVHMSRYRFGRRPVSLFRGPLRSFLRPSGNG
jgi:hypothetical protein